MPFDNTPEISPLVDMGNKINEILQAKGWCKYKLQDCNGSVCLIGAMNIIDHGTHDFVYYTGLAFDKFWEDLQINQLQKNLVELIAKYYPERVGYYRHSIEIIPNFNNHNNTTIDEIMELVSEAAMIT